MARIESNGRLGDLIAETRRAKGMTQLELAEKMGVSRGFIGIVENGRQRVTGEETIKKLAKALDLTMEDIYSAQSMAPHDAVDIIRIMTPSQMRKAREKLMSIIA